MHAAVIPTLTMLAIRHFKHGEPEADHEPKHPAVRFVLAAWNEGDGPALAKERIEYWRAIIPDIWMELLTEIREKDRIAIGWLITGTHTGDRPELGASGDPISVQGSAFLTLDDDKIVQVSAVFDALCTRGPDGRGRGPGLVAGA